MLCVRLQTSKSNQSYVVFDSTEIYCLVLFVSIVIKYVANCGLFKCNHILFLFVYTYNCHVLHLNSLNA